MLKTNLEPHFLLRDKPEWRRKGLSFFLSLLIHVLLFIVIIVFISPIEVYIYEDVRNVFIASDPELIFPNFIESPSVTSSAGSEMAPAGKPASAATGLPSQIRSSRDANLASDPEIDPSISTRYQLSLPPDYMLKLPSGFEIDPSLKREERKPYDYGSSQDTTAPKIDLNKYGYPGVSQFDPTRGLGQTYSQGTQVLPGGVVLVKARAYDLGPWAEKTVDIVMGNLILPPSQTATPSGEVEVSLVVDRDGGIVSFEVLSSSSSPRLDQAAIKALEMSSPLPRLPKNFPEQNLKLRLVFLLQ